MDRFYIIPMDEPEPRKRSPAYFHSRFTINPAPELTGVRFALRDYGGINVALVATQVDQVQHDFLAAQADVVVIPENIDQQVGAARLAATRSAVEDLRIPGNWIQETNTFREVLRTIAGLFLYAQQVNGISGGNVILRLEDNLSTQYNQLPATIQTAMLDVAIDRDYDISGLTGASTLRQILKAFADAWVGPIHFGFIDL